MIAFPLIGLLELCLKVHIVLIILSAWLFNKIHLKFDVWLSNEVFTFTLYDEKVYHKEFKGTNYMDIRIKYIFR